MGDEKRMHRESDPSEIVKVTPVDSPSKNFLVEEHLRRMPNLYARGLIYITVLMVMVALAYSILSRIDIVVECRSVARPASHKIRILSDRSGYIDHVFISEGELVEDGTPLFRISSKEGVSYRTKIEELRRSIPLKEEFYNNKITSVRDELKHINSKFTNNLKVKKLKLEQNNISLNSLESDLSYWQKEVKNLEKEFENTQKLFERQLTSIGEYNNIKSHLERARTEVEKLIAQKDITLRENSIIEKEIENAKLAYENDTKTFENELKNLELEKQTTIQSMKKELEMNKKMLSLKDGVSIEDTAAEKSDILKADRRGFISELYFRNKGEYVRESDLMCTILPEDSPLYMDITIANKDIGFIENDMEIKYKFDAFPFMDYGTLHGKVLAISPSAVEDMSQGFVYHVRGTLKKPYFEIKGKHYFVKAGMTATAEMLTEKKTIFSLLFRKLKG